MNRRGFLSIAATTPLVVGPLLVVAPSLIAASAVPEEIDLRRYYYMLWSEFQDLGAEMGVGMHDAHTISRAPFIASAIDDALSVAPPSSRALRVLTAAGL